MNSRYCSLVLLSALTSCNPVRDAGEVDRAVALFHQRLSSGLDDKIYDESALEFQDSLDRDTARKFLARIRRKMGTPLTASRISYRVGYNPDNTIVNTSYSTRFSNGVATETFSWRLVGGAAVLIGYNVQSPLLLTD